MGVGTTGALGWGCSPMGARRALEDDFQQAIKKAKTMPELKVEKVVMEALTARGWTEFEAKQMIDRISG